MPRSFTRGLIAGSIIGAAIGMAIPSRTNVRMKRKTVKNGMHIVKKAGNLIGDIIGMF